MIILDTNVVSEPLRPRPNARVTDWLDTQNPKTLYLTSITLGELWYGVAVLPDGQRKRTLQRRLKDDFLPLFAGRILPFSEDAAVEFAELQAAVRAQGRPLPLADAMIAAITRQQGYTLATRNIHDFEHAGVPLIDPWAGLDISE